MQRVCAGGAETGRAPAAAAGASPDLVQHRARRLEDTLRRPDLGADVGAHGGRQRGRQLGRHDSSSSAAILQMNTPLKPFREILPGVTKFDPGNHS